MSTQPTNGNPDYQTLWAAWEHFEPSKQIEIVKQVYLDVLGLPMAGVVEHLAGLREDVKRDIWREWAKRAELSGYTLQQIADLGESEPYHCVYAIIREWLARADLSKYSLAQIKKMSLLLRHKDDVQLLWSQWGKQADLTFDPDLIIIVLAAHKRQLGGWEKYGKAYCDRLSRQYHLTQYIGDGLRRELSKG
jgi:hypothetical protein